MDDLSTTPDAVRALPPEAPLPMPRATRSAPAQWLRASRSIIDMELTFLARLYVAGVTAGLTAFGVHEMYNVLTGGGITLLQWLFLALFAVNFLWISFAFAQASLGFFLCLIPPFLKPRRPEADPQGRTALLFPVSNEEPRRIAAAISAMAEDLAAEAPGQFDIFLLSDTNRAETWVGEEAVFRDLIRTAPATCPVYYRHRSNNAERKAGNVTDWVRRWGGAYEGMIVLDADSIMSARTLVTLTRRLAAAPGVALIQTLPGIVNGRTLFARLQQFANRCFGPIYAKGMAAWHGVSGNFWGHNAIIRTRAFAETCNLPLLPGKPPFGGHVLSHDFIEAALLRRAGWGVRMDGDIQETFEEAPPSLLDVIVRDRRWCQGNLQHSRFLFAGGLNFGTRLHLLSGIMAYMSAVFWFLLVMVGLMIAVQAEFVRPEYFAEPSLFPTWPTFDSQRAVQLFLVSLTIVLAPKVFGWLAALVNLPLCWRYGGPLALTAGVAVEAVLSALYAPVLMLAQCRTVFSVLTGADAGWQPQRREDGAVPFSQMLRAHRWHVVTGLVMAALAWGLNTQFFLWLTPVTAGLALSPVLSWISGSRRAGLLLQRLWCLRTPEEKRPPAIVARVADVLAAETFSTGITPQTARAALEHLRTDPALRRWHVAQLPAVAPAETRREMGPDTMTGFYKAGLGIGPRDLDAWLTPAEIYALMKERAFFEQSMKVAPG